MMSARWSSRLTIVLVVMAVGCSNIKNLKVTEKNRDKLWEQVKGSHDLSVEEVQLLQAYLIRNGLASALAGKEIAFPVGRTIGQMIDEQRKYANDEAVRTEQDRKLREKAKAADEEQRKQLREALSVTIYDKGFQHVDYEDYITLKFAYQNLSGRDIRGFKGVVVMSNLFGDKISSNRLVEDAVIKAGITKRVDRSLKYNQFDEESKALASKSLDNLRVEWIPEAILFTDGSTLNAPGVEE